MIEFQEGMNQNKIWFKIRGNPQQKATKILVLHVYGV